MRKMFAYLLFVAGLLSFTSCGGAGNKEEKVDWSKLQRNPVMPEWLYDAKFGIYFSWGLYSVPEMGSEWYPRSMYMRGNEAFEYHRKTYGDQAEFGYHDFVPMFTADKFDADLWTGLAQEAGAGFVGPIAEHHDGFSMWASKVNPWNAADMGPCRDVVGELCTSARKRGMKFFTSFHHARLLQRNACENNGGGYDSHFIYDTLWHTSSTDPKLRLLYGNMEEDEFHEYWLDKLKEVVDGYKPDFVYFDSWLNLIPESYRYKFCSYYFNESERRGQDVGISYKQFDLPKSVGVHDIEKGSHMEVYYPSWMTDDTICFGSWSYVKGQQVKPFAMVLHSLIDIVSKNGVLLLNVSPRADGSIPVEQQQVLKDLGKWLSVNGEAIYGTRPWWIHGGGPTMPRSNAHGGMETTNSFSSKDFRYLQSKDGKSFYVIFLGALEPGEVIRMRDFAPHRYPLPGKVQKVIELASGAEVALEETDSAFYFTMPDIETDKNAVVLKLFLE